MARDQAGSNIEQNRRQPSILKNQGTQCQRIEKQQGIRRSTRLQALEKSRHQSISKRCYIRRPQAPPSPPRTSSPANRSHLQGLHKSSEPSRKRKRGVGQGQEAGHPCHRTSQQCPSKRLPPSLSSCTGGEKRDQRAAIDTSENSADPIQFWITNRRWRKEYFEQDSQVRQDFETGKCAEAVEQYDGLQEHCFKETFREMHGFAHLSHLLARKKSSSSVRRKKSESSIQTPSDEQPREVKSAQYKSLDYEIALESRGSFMNESDVGIADNGRNLCRDLLQKAQPILQDSLFRGDLFPKTCRKIHGRNETMVIRDISLLIVPSAQTLATYGATDLNYLYESNNEGWNSAIPFLGTRPQPDYSIGFARSAFSEERLKKLQPFVDDFLYGSGLTSFFMATKRIYFPFLTCEVKCGSAALDIADRQNAHSMTIAVRGVIELYKAARREKELDREMLAFSISHDDRSVRVYGHYAIIEEEKISFYRHPITAFDFTIAEGKDKWTSYKFTKNLYDTWVPIQHKRLCSAIDDLPSNPDFDLSQSASFSGSDPQSVTETNPNSSRAVSEEVTPTTATTQTTERVFKKPRNRRAAGQHR